MVPLALLQSAERLKWDDLKFCTQVFQYPIHSWFHLTEPVTFMPTEVFAFNLKTAWLQYTRQEYAVLAKGTFSDVPDKPYQHVIQYYFSLQGAARGFLWQPRQPTVPSKVPAESITAAGKSPWPRMCLTRKTNLTIAGLNPPSQAFLPSSPFSRVEPQGFMAFKLRDSALAVLFHSCQHHLGKHLAYFPEPIWVLRVTLKNFYASRKRQRWGLPGFEHLWTNSVFAWNIFLN